MPEKRFAISGEAYAGIPPEKLTVRLDLVLLLHLQSAVETVKVDQSGEFIGDRLVQGLSGIINYVADLQNIDLCPLRQCRVMPPSWI